MTGESRSPLILGWVLPCVLVVAPLAQAEDPPPPLEVLTQQPHHLLGQGSKLSASLAFRWRDDLTEEDKEPPEPTVAWVQFGGHDPRALAQASSVRVVKPEATGYQWLEIEVDLGAFSPPQRHGTYTVRLEGRGEDDEQVYEQNVSLVRSKSTLVDPADLVLEQERLWSLWSGPLVAPPLRIASSAGPPPADIRIFEEGQARIGVQPTAGRLGYRSAGDGECPPPVEPLQDLVVNDLDPQIGTPVELGVLSPFGLGAATGTLKISSPDADPVAVGYTLSTRQPRWLIWLIAAVGLLLGFLVRVRWAHQIERNRALLRLDGLRREVGGLRRRFDSRTFQQALDEITQGLADVVAKLRRTSKAEEVTTLLTEVETLQAKIVPAVTAAETRRTQIRARLEPLREATTAAWSLPNTLAEAVETARSGWEEVARLLDAGALDAADDALSHTADRLADELAARTKDWKRALVSGLDELRREPAPLPPAVAQQLETAVDEVVETFEDDSPGGDDKARIEAGLTQAHQGMERTRELIVELGRTLGRAIRDVEKTLTAPGAPQSPKTLAALEGVIAGLRRIDGSGPPSAPSVGFPPLVTRISDALEATAEAIREEIRDPSAEPIVAAQLAQGNYGEAAEQALRKPVRGKQHAVPLTPPPAPDVDRWALAVREPLRARAMVVQRQAEVPDWRQIDPWRLQGEIARATFLRFVVIGIGLAFVAFLLFGDSFVGTPADWGKVLLWGFTTNIAADVLVAQAGEALG